MGTEDQRGSVTARHHTALMSGPNEILDQVPETLSSPASQHSEAFPGSCWKHPPCVHLAGLSRTLCPPHSLHQPCSGQPGSGMAPTTCVVSLLNPHCEQAPRRESLPEVTPLSSEAGRGALSSDERRAPSWGDREGDVVGKEPGFLGPSDGVCSQEGDGFLLASTSHPSPASPRWSQAPQAPPPHSSMACCETLEKPLPRSAQSLHWGNWYQSQHLVKA